MRRLLPIAWSSSILVLSWAAPSSAQEDARAEEAEAADPSDDEARLHFESGRSHFQSGRYEAAIAEFEAALALSPQPMLRYNLYLAHERQGNLAEAADHLERYLPDSGDQLDHLQSRLSNLRLRIAEESVERDADPPPDASPPPAHVDPAGSVPVGAVIGLAVGGAGLVAFGVFAGLATAEKSDLDDRCGDGRCSDDEVGDLETFSLLADIGLGVAAAGATVGVILLLTSGGGDDEPPLRAAPLIGPGTAGFGARGAF